MSADVFVPLRLDGTVITCHRGEYTYGGHPVVFSRREITHRPTKTKHEVLAMVHSETGLTIFCLVLQNESVLVLAPRISGGMSQGLGQVGEERDPAVLAFVKEQMALMATA